MEPSTVVPCPTCSSELPPLTGPLKVVVAPAGGMNRRVPGCSIFNVPLSDFRTIFGGIVYETITPVHRSLAEIVPGKKNEFAQERGKF